jgi:hypothetical protein
MDAEWIVSEQGQLGFIVKHKKSSGFKTWSPGLVVMFQNFIRDVPVSNLDTVTYYSNTFSWNC